MQLVSQSVGRCGVEPIVAEQIFCAVDRFVRA
jgi:hypothetical protein